MGERSFLGGVYRMALHTGVARGSTSKYVHLQQVLGMQCQMRSLARPLWNRRGRVSYLPA